MASRIDGSVPPSGGRDVVVSARSVDCPCLGSLRGTGLCRKLAVRYLDLSSLDAQRVLLGAMDSVGDRFLPPAWWKSRMGSGADVHCDGISRRHTATRSLGGAGRRGNVDRRTGGRIPQSIAAWAALGLAYGTICRLGNIGNRLGWNDVPTEHRCLSYEQSVASAHGDVWRLIRTLSKGLPSTTPPSCFLSIPGISLDTRSRQFR